MRKTPLIDNLPLLRNISLVSTALSTILCLMISPLAALVPSAIPMAYVLASKLKPVIAKKAFLKSCEEELPFAASFISMLVASGISPSRAFEKLSNTKTFKSFRSLANEVLKIRQVHALNPLDAISLKADQLSSENIRDFLHSITSIQRSGGDTFAAILAKTKEIHVAFNSKMLSLADKANLMANIEVLLFVIIPMSLLSIFALFGSSSSSLLASSLFLPLLFFTILLATIRSFFPSIILSARNLKPLLVFSTMSCVLAAFSHYLLKLNIHISSALGLTLSSIIGLLIGEEAFSTHELFNALADFSRDLAEEVKKGIAPKNALIQLTNLKQYRKNFKDLLKLLLQSYHLGLDPVKIVYNSKTPTAVKMFFELFNEAESVGADFKSMDVIAELYNSLRTAINSTKAKLLTFKFASYLCTFLLVFSISLLVEAILPTLYQPLFNTPLPYGIIPSYSSINYDLIKDLAYLGVFVNSYMLGFLGGYITSFGSIRESFKEAIRCLLIALIGYMFLTNLCSRLILPLGGLMPWRT
ncbi:MAG: hypothetical protein DRJ31_06760 [Candidatus Methanomethylicota archaeon]|uniref:Type II secretion system protein GspF domain-containing protein n=1 Tax=Thermoproteota archaeon TaxID=2056631 RepID=A0A497EML3_9CREN|nr:MAG: hypothetical protein DRJ31_06760 [Candidatus Verstraetearchaeota archaeon]